MSRSTQFERFTSFASLTLLLIFAVGLASSVYGQVRQPLNIPPTVGGIPNHAPPYAPNVPASVTSISPYNFNTPRFTNNYGYGRRGRMNGCNGYGCGNGYGGYGYGAAVPYYYIYPAYDPGYDTSGGGGPYLYSGPPQGQAPPAEQTLHIIVDTAPEKRASAKRELADDEPAMPAPQRSMPDAKPGLPTTLVYRDGHKQVVTNYAIMGQTLYVFDARAKKISLADLDVAATIKVNDDEGVEFQLPKTKQNSKPAKTSGVPLQSIPDESQKTSSSLTPTP